MQLRARRIVNLFLAVLAPALGSGTAPGAQTDLERAQTLIRRISSDRTNAKTALQKAALVTEIGSTLPEIERLTLSGIGQLLDSSRATSAAGLQEELESVLGNASVLKLPWSDGPVYVIAFTIASCADCSRSWLGAFANVQGHYTVIASAENSEPNRVVSLTPLPQHGGGARFLVSRLLLGDAHNRLDASAYELQARALRVLWSRLALPQGRVEVRNGTIILSFASGLEPSSQEVTEIYSFDRGKIDLRSRSVAR